MKRARQNEGFEEVLLTADTTEELEREIQEYLYDYPEIPYGTTIVRGDYVTLDGKHRAELRRWLH